VSDRWSKRGWMERVSDAHKHAIQSWWTWNFQSIPKNSFNINFYYYVFLLN